MSGFMTPCLVPDFQVAQSEFPQVTSTPPLVAPSLGTWIAQVQTTNATPTNQTLYAPAASQANQIRVSATALKSDGSKAATWVIVAATRNSAVPALTLLGATTLAAEADASFAPTLEVSVSGVNIVAILTGIGATTINWFITVEVA